jgi:hypothetical protein
MYVVHNTAISQYIKFLVLSLCSVHISGWPYCFQEWEKCYSFITNKCRNAYLSRQCMQCENWTTFVCNCHIRLIRNWQTSWSYGCDIISIWPTIVFKESSVPSCWFRMWSVGFRFLRCHKKLMGGSSIGSLMCWKQWKRRKKSRCFESSVISNLLHNNLTGTKRRAVTKYLIKRVCVNQWNMSHVGHLLHVWVEIMVG